MKDGHDPIVSSDSPQWCSAKMVGRALRSLNTINLLLLNGLRVLPRSRLSI